MNEIAFHINGVDGTVESFDDAHVLLFISFGENVCTHTHTQTQTELENGARFTDRMQPTYKVCGILYVKGI